MVSWGPAVNSSTPADSTGTGPSCAGARPIPPVSFGDTERAEEEDIPGTEPSEQRRARRRSFTRTRPSRNPSRGRTPGPGRYHTRPSSASQPTGWTSDSPNHQPEPTGQESDLDTQRTASKDAGTQTDAGTGPSWTATLSNAGSWLASTAKWGLDAYQSLTERAKRWATKNDTNRAYAHALLTLSHMASTHLLPNSAYCSWAGAGTYAVLSAGLMPRRTSDETMTQDMSRAETFANLVGGLHIANSAVSGLRRPIQSFASVIPNIVGMTFRSGADVSACSDTLKTGISSVGDLFSGG